MDLPARTVCWQTASAARPSRCRYGMVRYRDKRPDIWTWGRTKRPCSDFMDMLRRLISCRIIIIIIFIFYTPGSKDLYYYYYYSVIIIIIIIIIIIKAKT